MRFHSKNQQITKAEYLSSAFLIFYEQLPKEDTIYYSQVKGRDMIGYFLDNELYQFDVEGGAQTIYYMSEDSVVVNVDIAESDNLIVYVKERKIQRMKYIARIKNDVHPLDDAPSQEKMVLRGFELRGEERPATRFDVCTEIPKASRREEVSLIPMPTFPITERFDALEKKR